MRRVCDLYNHILLKLSFNNSSSDIKNYGDIFNYLTSVSEFITQNSNIKKTQYKKLIPVHNSYNTIRDLINLKNRESEIRDKKIELYIEENFKKQECLIIKFNDFKLIELPLKKS